MRVTVVFNDLICSQDVTEDLELEGFVALLKDEWPSLAQATEKLNFLFFNDHIRVPVLPTELKKTLKDLGFQSDEVVNLMAAPKLSEPAAQDQQRFHQLPQSSRAPQAAPAVSGLDLRNLISQIKVPKKHAVPAKTSVYDNPNDIKVFAKRIWDTIKANPDAIRSFKLTAPNIANAYQSNPNDFESFLAAVRETMAERKRLETALKDEMSADAQRYIAQQIKIQNIEEQYKYALEHLPEAYIPVKLLHILVKINGVEVLAMVDSGAQNSILSPSIAKKCNVYEFVDERFFSRANGIGGDSKILGRIHGCKMQIGSSYTTCSFDVLEEQKVEILLGLSFLRPNQCIIDLRRNVMVLGDDTEVPFLGEEEYKREVVRLGHVDLHASPPRASEAPSTSKASADSEVDSAKLAELIGMGVDADKATVALKKFNNNLQQAIDALFDEPMQQ
ncbi:unnamed protein product [Bursaphelenchus okinawaensis]|uniref:UBA domain-containing protein n=1 Tax=Bursaphelenchus okinawaensis TaxID=465554 RepID=A0A811LNK0_9BILA|nr:unnamed protein product [Bursaphelenchus okinawaensis]CAG9127151.1 unnamed protein product [Bursaphelenchus okinawaensis]